MQRVCKFVNFANRDTNCKHNLKLILHLHGLRGYLALFRFELRDIFFRCLLGGSRGFRRRIPVRYGSLWTPLKVLAEHLDLPNELVCTGFDWHACAVVSLRIQDSLALHTFDATGEFQFAHTETMSSMQDAVHIWISSSTKPFWVFGVQLIGCD